MSFGMDEIMQRVVEKLNKELGSDFQNLIKCDDIIKKYQNENIRLEQLLNIERPESTSHAAEVLRNIQKDSEIISAVSKEFEGLSAKVVTHLSTTNKVLRTLQSHVDNVHALERAAEYMQIAKKIENISGELHQSLVAKDDELSVTLYANLCEISLSLQDSPASHLVAYLKDVIHHWHNHLKDKFAVEFDAVLAVIKWPFVSTNFNVTSPSPDTITKLQLLTEYLLQIQLPEETAKPIVTSALLSDFPPLSLPIVFLIRPLRKRFMYHFYGTKQTNRNDKPEWYMTQILTWIRDHEKFIHTTIQPVVDRLALHHVNVKLEFMRGLVQLCVEKLDAELPSLAFDDGLFSHCVDEALGMDRELRQVYWYPNGQPGPVGPLTHAPILQKWLNMEKKYALEKMDAMLVSETAWSTLTTAETDDLKITECGDSFITLLATMTERYQPLPQPGHRLQFLDLQLDLLDDFRIRLLQLLHEASNDIVTSNISHILNTVHYIGNVLIEWSGMIQFIHLHYFKYQFTRHGAHVTSDNPTSDQLESAEEGSVFDETLSLYNHMRDDLILTLSEAVVMDVKARSRPYRRDSWFTMPTVKDTVSLSLTTSACPMFQLLATRLHQLEEVLASSMFSEIWRNIAKQLNVFLLEELILENHFNEGGAMQLNYDITRNLFPLFAQYSTRPDSHFIHVKEACMLLTLAKGSALLLREEINGIGECKQREALQEVGIKKLAPDTAIMVLNQRVDLKLI